ncbi:MAG: hypothetical protein WD077_13575 [Bacteroidia bacterium]
MENDKLNIDQLEKEKLLLEIEELKNQITGSEKGKVWKDYYKPLIPVLVTLIIAIFGWIITLDFNNSQIEIAQIEASLSYINTISEIQDSSAQLKRQAQTVIAPVLPPETSFNLAVDEVENNPNLLAVLIRTYPKNFWEYLIPHIENYPQILSDSDSSTANNYSIFDFLDKKKLINSYYQIVTSEEYDSPERVFGLINYFTYLDSKYKNSNFGNYIPQGKKKQLEYRLLSTVQNSSNNILKADISKASSVILDQSGSDKKYSELAAKFFWEDYDVSFGETPSIDGVDQFIYRERFLPNPNVTFIGYPQETHMLDSLSTSLYTKLSDIDYQSLEIDRIETILYSYIEGGNINAPTTPYLKPDHSLEIVKMILSSLTTEEKRREFSEYLGSSAGDLLFSSIAYPDGSNERVGKEFSDQIIKWYRSFWNEDWHKPEFLSTIIDKYPDLKSKIDKKWGVEID